MTMAARRCAIVDAYSTGRFLADALRGYGVDCVHVQSQPDIIPNYRAGFRPDDFSHRLICHGSAERVASDLAALGVGYVIAGAETGVTLAEALAHLLRLPGNAWTSPGARRDKAVMARCLRRAGLAAPAGLRTDRLDRALTWAVRRGDWPVVVKPVASAFTDQVFFCANPAAIRQAFSAIMVGENILGLRNEAVLVQEYLCGDEYAVNSVSWAGRHHMAEVWRYTKRRLPGASTVYDFEEPLTFHDPRVGVLAEYTRQALTALGVRYGPAHSEVMLTARGPVLVETGARLAGVVLPDVMTRHFGVSQVDLTARVIAAPESFGQLLETPVRTHGYLRNVFLIVDRGGTLATDQQFAMLRTLPSYAGASVSARAGRYLPRTVDLGSSPGHVYLHAEDGARIAEDYARLRGWEQTTLYPTTDRMDRPLARTR